MTIVFAVFALVPACSAPSTPADGAPGSDGASDAAAPGDAADAGPDAAEIAWETCPLADGDPRTAECATVTMPARWDRPAEGTIPVFVKRWRSGRADAGQLWLLNGGPGAPGGDSAVGGANAVRSFGVAYDVYVPDHRGTGSSAMLECPGVDPAATSAQFAMQCGAELRRTWGASLDGFSTTNAAHDVGELIARTRTPGQRVVVYGGSYGSYWAHRYLQLYPSQADGVAMDGLCLSSTCRFTNLDRAADTAARRVLEACGHDASCAARLGADPFARLADVLGRVERDGHCAALGLSADGLRALVVSVGTNEARLLPAVVYRVARCASGDVTALRVLFAQLGFGAGLRVHAGLGGGAIPGYSVPLHIHVALSELWPDPPPSLDELAAADAMLTITQHVSVDNARAVPYWPRYPRDAYVDRWAETRTPLLMMHGTFDFLTPLDGAMSAAAHFTAPHQRLIVVPGGPHGAIWSSNCALLALRAFLRDPQSDPGDACTAPVPAGAFDLSATDAMRWLGTASPWD